MVVEERVPMVWKGESTKERPFDDHEVELLDLPLFKLKARNHGPWSAAGSIYPKL
jgi:hypothetical protein